MYQVSIVSVCIQVRVFISSGLPLTLWITPIKPGISNVWRTYQQ